MDKEKTIQSYMEKLKISREEAEQLFEDDLADYIGEEGEEMSTKAKEIKRYEQSAEPRKKSTRVKKEDAEKLDIISTIAKNLTRTEAETTDIKIVNAERQIDFRIGGNDYSITLTKHRKSTK